MENRDSTHKRLPGAWLNGSTAKVDVFTFTAACFALAFIWAASER